MSRDKKGHRTILRNRNFLLLWFDQTLSQLSYSMLNFALVLRIYDLTGSNTAVSLLVVSVLLPSVLFGVLAGVASDAFDRRKVMLATNLLWGVLVLGFLAIGEKLLWILAFTFIINAVDQFFIPAEAASLPMVVKREELMMANSLFSFTVYASLVGGYVLAGPIIALLGIKAAFVLASLATFLAAATVWFLPPLCSGEIFLKKSMVRGALLRVTVDEIRKGWNFVGTHNLVAIPMTILVLVRVMTATVAVLAPGFVVEVLKIPATTTSYFVMAPLAAGLILGAFGVGKFGRRLPKRSLVGSGVLTGGTILTLISILPLLGNFLMQEIWLLTTLSFLLGLSSAAVVIPTQTVLQENTPTEIRGRIFGVFNMVAFSTSCLPILFAGKLADVLGNANILLAIGVGTLLIGVVGTKTRLVTEKLTLRNRRLV